MSVLKNARHEAFCQNMIIHKDNQTKAYQEAGYSSSEDTARKAASRLMTNVDIQKRLDELRSKAENKALVTLEEVVESLKRIAQTAEAGDQLAVAKGCWQDLGKVVGAFIDKKELSGPGGKPIETETVINIIPVKAKNNGKKEND